MEANRLRRPLRRELRANGASANGGSGAGSATDSGFDPTGHAGASSEFSGLSGAFTGFDRISVFLVDTASPKSAKCRAPQA
jgi:hypothetical protein